MSVALTIQGMLDYIAKVRQISQDNVTGGTDLWSRVDASDDEAFENRVKGQYLTDADTALETGALWSAPALKKVFTLLEDYCRIDAGESVPYLGNYLASLGIRAPWEAAEAIAEGGITRLLPGRVFAKGTLPANEADPDPATSGMHKFGRWASTGATAGTFTETDGELLITRISGAPVMAVNMSANQTATLTIRCYKADQTAYKDIAVGFSGASQYTQVIAGQAAVTSSISAGATSIASTGVGSAGNIIAGEYALIWESDDLQEVILVGTVTTNAIAVAAGVKNTYTTGAVIMPLFTDAVPQSVTGATNGQNIDIFARPDRIIDIT